MEFVAPILSIISVILLVMLLLKKDGAGQQQALIQALQAELERFKQQAQQNDRQTREEQRAALSDNARTVVETLTQLSQLQQGQLAESTRRMDAASQRDEQRIEGIAKRMGDMAMRSDEQLTGLRDTLAKNILSMQQDNAQQLDKMRQTISETLNLLSLQQQKQLADFAQQMEAASQRDEQRMESIAKRMSDMAARNDELLTSLREGLAKNVQELQQDNARQLDKMRETVDEKLSGTLEKRLGESFKLVSERLEQVYKGLGEMQTLASGVGDLKKVLTNVKTRGTWGEVQLGALLEQMLTPSQYAANIATKRGSADRVEFAVRLPGRQEDEPIYLPIDAKFPMEDYQRIVDASSTGDAAAVEIAARALESRIKLEAKTIAEKYIDVPATTDFAILFLPVEGLYAEVLRRPGLTDALQRDYRVSIAGPTTLMALLNSLQMGFRTLAIQQRSDEVWRTLGEFKNEFGKFSIVLAHTKKKLQEASNVIDKAEVRTRAIQRKLRDVEQVQDTAQLEDAEEDDLLLLEE